MKISDLANEISRRTNPGEPYNEMDISRLELIDIEALLLETEVATQGTLDTLLAASCSGEKTHHALTRAESWFLSQRWECAADFLARLASSQSEQDFPLSLSSDNDRLIYHWLLIDVWREWRGYWLHNTARRLFREQHS